MEPPVATPAAAVELDEDGRKHLEFLQGVIARMSAASGLAKGWCLTVTTATLGYALTKRSCSVALLGVAAVILFGSLDARYLREERKFRALYNGVRSGQVDRYDMGTVACTTKGSAIFDGSCEWPAVLKSWSILSFYVPLALVCVAALLSILSVI